jgi:hypothetical protein
MINEDFFKNIRYEEYPFPLFYGRLPKEFYREVLQSWPVWKHKRSGRNDMHFNPRKKSLVDPLHDMIFFSWNMFFKTIFKSEKTISKENIRIQYSENSASNIEKLIRGWHLDAGSKQMIVLWYFRDKRDSSTGGNLQLMNSATGVKREIPYEPNSIVIFPNFINCWHSISPRSPSDVPRRFLNIVIEKWDDEEKMHQYGNSDLVEYDRVVDENYDDDDVKARYEILKKYEYAQVVKW